MSRSLVVLHALFSISLFLFAASLIGQENFSSLAEADGRMHQAISIFGDLADQSDRICEEARLSLDSIQEDLSSYRSGLEKGGAQVDLLRRRGVALGKRIFEAKRKGQRIYQAGLSVTEAHTRCREAARKACERMIKISDSSSSAQRTALLTQAKTFWDQTRAHQRIAEAAAKPVPVAMLALELIENEADHLRKDFDQLEYDLEELERYISTGDDRLDKGEVLREELEKHLDRLNDAFEALSEVYDEAQVEFGSQAQGSAKSKSVLEGIAELYRQANSRMTGLSSCEEELETQISDLEESLQAMGEEWQRLMDDSQEVLHGLTEDGGSYEEIRQVLLNSKAGDAVITRYLSEIETALAQANTCIEKAKAETEGRLTISVPNLKDLAIEEALRRLESAKLGALRFTGSETPTPKQAFTIERQLPKAGQKLGLGEQVSLWVYQPTAQEPKLGTEVDKGDFIVLTTYQAPGAPSEMPSLIGLSEQEARKRLDERGIPYIVQTGNAASSAEDEGRIYQQIPLVGESVDALDGKVMLITYGAYQGSARSPGPSDPGSGLFVACHSYFPELPDSLEEGKKYKDWIRTQTADKVALSPTEAPVFLWLEGAGQRAYSQEWLKGGARLSCPMQLVLADPKKGKSVSLHGALLLQVIDSFSTYAAFAQRFPPDQYAEKGQKISFLHFKRGDGTFDDGGNPKAQMLTYRGGPMLEGWPPNMRAGNLALYRGALDYLDCFVASAVYQSWNHPVLDTLRSFRDEILLEMPLGRCLVHAYYRLGPRLAALIRGHGMDAQTLRVFLDHVVQRIDSAEEDIAAKQELAEQLLALAEPLAQSIAERLEPVRVIDPLSLIVSAAAKRHNEGVLGEETAAVKAASTGDIYFYGEGVPADHEQALEWYLQAAELGSAEAMNNAGFIYERGLGVDKDLNLAFFWYRKAAEMELPVAMNNLGWMYFNGLGIEQDFAEAHRWYLKGAEADDPNAQSNLAWMYQSGTGLEVSFDRAFFWYEKAAYQDLADAQFNLAWMYLNGRGTAQDLDKALTWYVKAGEAGSARAQAALGWLFEQGIEGGAGLR